MPNKNVKQARGHRPNKHGLTEIIGKKIPGTTLTVVKEVTLQQPNRKGSTKGYLCRCDCGNTIVATREKIIGKLKSCGCLSKKSLSLRTDYVEGTRLSKIDINKPAEPNSSTGIRGVRKRNGRYVAEIGIKGKKIHLGSFDKLEDAKKARKEAEQEYYVPILQKHEKKKPSK